jgi:hypothetical protein
MFLYTNIFWILVLTLNIGLFLYRKKSNFYKNLYYYTVLHSAVFLLIYVLVYIFQAASYAFYIFEEVPFDSIVLKRTFLGSGVGILAFSMLYILSSWVPKKWKKHVLILFLFPLLSYTLFVFFDVGVLRYSGLHITPTALLHANNGWAVLREGNIPILVFACIGSLFLITWIYIQLLNKLYIPISKHIRYIALGMFSAGIILYVAAPLQSIIYTLPERLIFIPFRSQYTQLLHRDNTNTSGLPKELQEKLTRFGIIYDYEDFHLSSRNSVRIRTSTPDVRAWDRTTKPNVIIIFLESFSSRISSVYNTTIGDTTPFLKQLSTNEDVTTFHNFYNASTPTITGLLSLLCSHYTTTNHLSFAKGMIGGHNLDCLPEILQSHGFNYTSYMTAVSKTYTSKDVIFRDMGITEVLGKEDIAKIIDTDTNNWGYSDRQLYPAFWKHISNIKEQQPFLAMVSNVDTHTPYGVPDDGVYLADGTSNILDSFYSSDQALELFWKEFEASDLYDNTMVVFVADHAIFPNKDVQDVFPEEKFGYYDENVFLMYVPESTVPKKVTTRASGVDFTPTLLDVLDIETPISAEGYSIFDARELYPNILGMHDLDIFISEEIAPETYNKTSGTPTILYCSPIQDLTINVVDPLTICEFYHFYNWKKIQFTQGRFWKK